MNAADNRPDLPKPPWIRTRLPHGPSCERVREILRSKALHTVCEEAVCPNRGECWGQGTATFLIMGDRCTRSCAFCAVESGRPEPLNPREAVLVAETVRALGLTHVVITSVTRDDLPDGGASAFEAVILEIRLQTPGCGVEVLIPDFRGADKSLDRVIGARPQVLGHNIETVRRLYGEVRPQADYEGSLTLLRRAKEREPNIITKSGIMVGLGEKWEEILNVFQDLRRVNCDLLTIGQYLRPSRQQLPVKRYYDPADFETLRRMALDVGFPWVEAGPFVRSSYHAETALRNILGK